MDDRKENLIPSPEETENETIQTEFEEGQVNQTEPEVKFETEGSTIFAKHVYNTKKPAKSGWKKRIGIVSVSFLLCICIAVGAFLVVKFIPNVNHSQIPSVVSQEAIEVLKYSDYVKETTLKTNSGELLTSINVSGAGIHNYYEDYVIMPHTEKVSTGKNETVDSITWYIQGLDRNLTVTDVLYEHLSLCMNIKAIAKMENTYSSVEEYHETYGLSNAKCSRAFYIMFNDGTESIEIMVGDQIATRDGNYLKVSGDDTVYIVSSEYIRYYDYLPSHFADLDVLEPIKETVDNTKYFTTNNLSRFDYVKISGKMLNGKSYEFGMSTDVSADYMPYVMMKPYRRPASDEFLANILSFASSGITADGLYTFEATDENKKLTGMNDPSCVIEVKIGDYYFKLTIGGFVEKDETGLSAMINGKKQIFMIEAEALDFIDPDITTMFNYNFIMENIYEIKSVTFENNTGKHTYHLTHTPLPDNPDAFTTEVKYNGKKVSDESFKALYQRVLLLSLLSFVIEEERTEPVFTITFKYNGDYKDRVVEFTESPRDSYHYVAWIDGVPLGEVLKSSVTDITDNLANYLAGGTVPKP